MDTRETIKEAFEKILTTVYSSVHFQINCADKLNYFCLGGKINKDAKVEISFWGNDGNISLCSCKCDPTVQDTIIDYLTGLAEDFCRGYIRCSDCGKRINLSEVAGNYFAGVYCEDCWNKTWRAIEARETYD